MWYGLKLDNPPVKPPFKKYCPNCHRKSLELNVDETHKILISCGECGTELSYDKKRGGWSLSSGGSSLGGSEFSAEELRDVFTESEMKAKRNANPHSSPGSSGNDTKISEITCPSCRETSLSVQKAGKIACCENCSAKLKLNWGKWKLIQGQSEYKGQAYSPSEWMSKID
jgi:uncharacterized CHY-type Zn-finger protein